MQQPIARFATIVAVMAIAFAFTPGAQAAPITYDLVNVPADQNGWTVSGHMTTTGTTGSLAAADVTSWDFTLTKGATSYAATGSTPSNISNILATSDAIIVQNLPVTGLTLTKGVTSLSWTRLTPSFEYYSATQGSNLWQAFYPSYAVDSAGGWIIATATPSGVPEIDPATGSSALSLVAGVLAMIEQRRRRATPVA
jgi:hypothetical protein